MATKGKCQDSPGKGVSYNAELHKLQSAVDNAMMSLQRASKVLASLIEEQAEGKEE